MSMFKTGNLVHIGEGDPVGIVLSYNDGKYRVRMEDATLLEVGASLIKSATRNISKYEIKQEYDESWTVYARGENSVYSSGFIRRKDAAEYISHQEWSDRLVAYIEKLGGSLDDI